jgi:predicted aconitase with swiveling domain
MILSGKVLLSASGLVSGRVLKLHAPLSFWGGVDPRTGLITQGGHPEKDRSVSGTILAIPATIGSSSSSAVLAELIRRGAAPKAILLQEVDAILIVGALVAREMGWPAPLVVQVPIAPLPEEGGITADPDGSVSWCD